MISECKRRDFVQIRADSGPFDGVQRAAGKAGDWLPKGYVLVSTNYRLVPDADPLAQARDVARALALRAGEMAVEVRRTLSQNGRPIVLDDIWLPAQLFTGLTAQRMGDYKGPLYGLFESEFGVRMIRAEEKIRAVAADAEVAGVLGIEAGSPLLSVERLSFTYGDKPVELRRGFYNTSTHHYRNELS